MYKDVRNLLFFKKSNHVISYSSLFPTCSCSNHAFFNSLAFSIRKIFSETLEGDIKNIDL